MSLQRFLANRPPARANPPAPAAAPWQLDVSAGGGPDDERVWWTPERLAPIDTPEATLNLFEEIVVSPTWQVREGDFGRVLGEGRLWRTYVWAPDRDEPSTLRAVAVPTPAAMFAACDVPLWMRDNAVFLQMDWTQFWASSSFFESVGASQRMSYLWHLGLSRLRLNDALARCLREELHHLPEGDRAWGQGWLDLAAQWRRRDVDRVRMRAASAEVSARAEALEYAEQGRARPWPAESELLCMVRAFDEFVSLLAFADSGDAAHIRCLGFIARAAARNAELAGRDVRTEVRVALAPCGGAPDLDRMLRDEVPLTELMLAFAAQTQQRLEGGVSPAAKRVL